MPTASPRLRVLGACRKIGDDQVIRRCLYLLAGGYEDADFIVTLGGPAALHLLNDGMPDERAYWVRVWAARGLLWAGTGNNTRVLRQALSEDSWRVREMVCKVVARHCVGDLLDEVAALESDPIRRMRAAASRAVARIVEAEA